VRDSRRGDVGQEEGRAFVPEYMKYRQESGGCGTCILLQGRNTEKRNPSVRSTRGRGSNVGSECLLDSTCLGGVGRALGRRDVAAWRQPPIARQRTAPRTAYSGRTEIGSPDHFSNFQQIKSSTHLLKRKGPLGESLLRHSRSPINVRRMD
jgi:hypothetical protein